MASPSQEPVPTTEQPELEPNRLTPAVQALIAINIAVMFVQLTVYSALPNFLAFDTASLPVRWWSAITYMFAHVAGWQIAANVYALYLFGPRLERVWGAKKFAWFYVVCGLGGVIFQMLFIRAGTLVGASAAAFGIMTSYVMQWPDDDVYLFFVLPMRARTLITGLLVFNLAAGVMTTGDTGGTNVAYLAHIGGIVVAYAYMRVSFSATMEQVRQRVANLPDADEPPRAIPRTPPRRERGDEVDDIVAKSKAIVAKRTVALTPTSRRRSSKADELNRVLDKISEHGLASLTPDEKKTLEEMSRRLRDS